MTDGSFDPSRNKRMVVLSDGREENKIPTNILKLAIAIRRTDDEGVEQIAKYDAGVGTDGGLNTVTGGALGVGIDKNIKELYMFLAMNYVDGDEIYMFGYSRGAYTVRSLGGMIDNVGLIRREHLPMVNHAYELYRKKVPTNGDETTKFRAEYGEAVPIKLLCCFDTVGALGLPGNDLIGALSRQRYQFHDTVLGAKVSNAIHMMSIDEDRQAFKPTYMEAHPIVGTDQLTQLFFWGGHGGIGGGDGRQLNCSDITLRFLIGEMEKRSLKLSIDKECIPDEPDNLVPVINLKNNIFENTIYLFGRYVRTITSCKDVHSTAIVRYKKVDAYRPDSLKPLHDQLLAYKV